MQQRPARADPPLQEQHGGAQRNTTSALQSITEVQRSQSTAVLAHLGPKKAAEALVSALSPMEPAVRSGLGVPPKRRCF